MGEGLNAGCRRTRGNAAELTLVLFVFMILIIYYYCIYLFIFGLTE